jgi:hypothetical protein
MKINIAAFGVMSVLLVVSIGLVVLPLHIVTAMNQTMPFANASNQSNINSNSTSNQTLSSNSTANATDGDIIGAGRRK